MAEETATGPPAGESVGRPEDREGAESALACVGSKLDEVGGASVGRIEAVLADAVDGAPSWLVVKLGRFGKRAAVPFDYVAPGVGHAWVPFDRDSIRAAAELDPVAGLSAADERALLTHYGVPDGSGRHSAVAGRDDEDLGSVPV